MPPGGAAHHRAVPGRGVARRVSVGRANTPVQRKGRKQPEAREKGKLWALAGRALGAAGRGGCGGRKAWLRAEHPAPPPRPPGPSPDAPREPQPSPAPQAEGHPRHRMGRRPAPAERLCTRGSVAFRVTPAWRGQLLPRNGSSVPLGPRKGGRAGGCWDLCPGHGLSAAGARARPYGAL